MIKDKNMEELFKSAQNGNMEATEAIVKQYMGLVYSIAKKYANKKHITFDDAVQVGSLALLLAIRDYNPNLNIQFSTYAFHKIQGKISQYIRDCREDIPFRIPRKNYYEYRKINEIRNKTATKLNRYPTSKELAKEMGITVQEVNKTLNLMEFKFYLDEYVKDTKDDAKKIEQKEVLANTNNLTEDQIITQIMVRDAIEKLPNKEKQVIELRYFQDKSQEAAGKILNTTQVTISRKEKSALKHLKMIFETGKIEKEIKPPREYNRQTFDININTVNLSGLTELQKKVVYLVTVEKLGYSEIGRRLGKSRANIYSIMRYANKKLEKNS